MTSKADNGPLSDDDEITRAINKRFDELLARMNQPGAMERASKALFGASVQELTETYRPGTTERRSDD